MSLNIIDLKQCSYKISLELQVDTHNKVFNQELNNSIIFVEHEHVYTLGKNADQNNILTNYPKDVEIYNIDRGGDVTYHGPGQLVGYPIINIKNLNMSIGRYIHTLEGILINALKEFDISAQIRDKLIGVWVGDEKIGAIGVAVIIEGRHLCMQMRGVEKQNSFATTSAMIGEFHDEVETRNEFFSIIGLKNL